MLSRTLDTLATRNQGLLLLLGRLAIGALYVPAGYGHLTGLNGFAQYLASKGLPGPAMAWAVVAAVVEFFASLAVVVGFQTRAAALLLVIFTIVAALTGHPFWTVPADQYQNQYVHFFKDIAIIGGLLYVFVRGAGPISVDRH